VSAKIQNLFLALSIVALSQLTDIFILGKILCSYLPLYTLVTQALGADI
jgi:hypothetical protein